MSVGVGQAVGRKVISAYRLIVVVEDLHIGRHLLGKLTILLRYLRASLTILSRVFRGFGQVVLTVEGNR